ncbi:MAG: heterodisulfide reductase-related iron-sulfur binding cluster [Candidatus Aminicenantes bacterium]|nr:heterodisulfide reductase-related iron-sulfur binding cluster [Candidatus Aminicenantes bacterium]
MLSTPEKIIFLLVIAATLAAFGAPILRRYRIVRAGRPENRFDRIAGRIGRALGKILLQRCTLKDERLFTGLMHVLIFYGALTFDTMTVNHALEGFFDGFFLFGASRLGLLFSFAVDLFGILVLVGVAYFIVRRFLIRPPAYATTRGDSAVIYASLILVTLTYFYFEAFTLAAQPDAVRWSFLGIRLARGIASSGLSTAAIAAQVKVGWWAHILTVFGFIAYVPHSKYLHMFTGPLNLVFGKPEAGRSLEPLDLENSEVFGLEKAADWTWKDNLDALACMECGRCQDACPAFASGKPLSPKMIILNQEKHLLAHAAALRSGKREALPPLVPEVHSEGEIWTCTTCGACMHVCPVEIEHIPKIVGARRSRVLMESAFPAELNGFFRNLETNGNPWGIGFAKRGDWAAVLGVPTAAEHPGAEYLFWVGCAGSYDEKGTAIAASLARLLKKAGIDFSILGAEEKCCGDSARRLGQEYLFQTLAQENLAVLAARGVRKIITACPHGYNALKNEYPKLIDRMSDLSAEAKERLRGLTVVHHADFLRRLVEEGRLTPRPAAGTSAWTYHDPCYLGRHNGVIEEPRALLGRLAGGTLRELENNKEHSFCCGAGGGLMWTEETLGRRISHLRADEIARSGAGTVATACPFCQTMLGDALKEQNREGIEVKDIAQLLDEATS